MKKNLRKTGLLILSILLVFNIVLILQNIERNNYQKFGAYLIDKIETFRQTENRLPNSVEELGLEEPMNSGPYYKRKDSVNYVIFFTVGFDETFIYYSDKKEWRMEKE